MENLEKLQTYRSIIKQLLNQYASYKPSHGDMEIHNIFDTENDHYQVMAIGWDKKERVYGCSVHLEIKNGKIWIQNNNTEWDIGQDLVNMNVPKNDIVIGFQPPSMRQYSGYGTK